MKIYRLNKKMNISLKKILAISVATTAGPRASGFVPLDGVEVYIVPVEGSLHDEVKLPVPAGYAHASVAFVQESVTLSPTRQAAVAGIPSWQAFRMQLSKDILLKHSQGTSIDPKAPNFICPVEYAFAGRPFCEYTSDSFTLVILPGLNMPVDLQFGDFCQSVLEEYPASRILGLDIPGPDFQRFNLAANPTRMVDVLEACMKLLVPAREISRTRLLGHSVGGYGVIEAAMRMPTLAGVFAFNPVGFSQHVGFGYRLGGGLLRPLLETQVFPPTPAKMREFLEGEMSSGTVSDVLAEGYAALLREGPRRMFFCGLAAAPRRHPLELISDMNTAIGSGRMRFSDEKLIALVPWVHLVIGANEQITSPDTGVRLRHPLIPSHTLDEIAAVKHSPTERPDILLALFRRFIQTTTARSQMRIPIRVVGFDPELVELAPPTTTRPRSASDIIKGGRPDSATGLRIFETEYGVRRGRTPSLPGPPSPRPADFQKRLVRARSALTVPRCARDRPDVI
jgi:pimeloyl-ACP methyl ester carboxylesterase